MLDHAEKTKSNRAIKMGLMANKKKLEAWPLPAPPPLVSPQHTNTMPSKQTNTAKGGLHVLTIDFLLGGLVLVWSVVAAVVLALVLLVVAVVVVLALVLVVAVALLQW